MISHLKDKTLTLAAFFSLSLHGLLASFLITSASQISMARITPVQIIWERMSPPSQAYSPPRKKSPLFKEKKRLSPPKALSQIKNVHKNTESSADSPEKKHSSPDPVFHRKAHHPLPGYPWVCRKRHQEGMVSLDVKTNAAGRVLEVNLRKSSGYSRLDEVALEAVKTWTFAEGNFEKILLIAFRLKG